MKPVLFVFVVLVCLPGSVWARGAKEAPPPTQMVEIRGEKIRFYESMKAIGTPRTVKPEFPRDDHGNRISGRALIGVLVDESGAPIEVEVVESNPGGALGEKAAAAVKKWQFPKLSREGKPTKYITRVPLVFEDRT